MSERITLAHGNGGQLTHALIHAVFRASFANAVLDEAADSARLTVTTQKLAFTTDAHVVNPLFFAGGDMGKLAVCGTLNDLAVMGARPRFLSCAFILEEGLEIAILKKLVASMARAAQENQVLIVTGDTKVVEKGAADKVFITTSGIGEFLADVPLGPQAIQEGDEVIITGSLGDHGVAIYAGREGIALETDAASDCACIYPLVERALAVCPSVRVMRDPTRGGLATTLNEFVQDRALGIEVMESAVPVKASVQGVCEVLGFDPFYIANEGKLVLIVPREYSTELVRSLRTHPLGGDSAVIGRVTKRYPGRVTLQTLIGGERILNMLLGDMLPRIC